MHSPVPGASSQAGYGVTDTMHSPLVEAHTSIADSGAVPRHQKPFSFIKTVPMQHVQSHYAEERSDLDRGEQLIPSVQPLSLNKAWLTQLTAPPFTPLISFTPESSCSSFDQPELAACTT